MPDKILLDSVSGDTLLLQTGQVDVLELQATPTVRVTRAGMEVMYVEDPGPVRVTRNMVQYAYAISDPGEVRVTRAVVQLLYKHVEPYASDYVVVCVNN